MAKSRGMTFVVDVVRLKALWPELKARIIETAIADGPGVIIGLEAAGQQGIAISDLMADPALANYTIKPHKPEGDKYARALPLAPRMQQGVIRICHGPWNGAYIDELCAFEAIMQGHDDQVDSTSGAWLLLNKNGTLKPFRTGVYPFTPDDKTDLVSVAAIELFNYNVHIVRAVWQPYLGVLQIVDELCNDMIPDTVKALSRSKYRWCSTDIDSNSMKSVLQALVTAQCPCVPVDLDVEGAVMAFNAMADKIYVYYNPAGTQTPKLYSELMAFDKTMEPTPYVSCVLKIIQEIRKWQRSPEYQSKPFETKRGSYYQNKMKQKIKDWVE
jgi:predicted phage terminase large subunit-like protein